MEAGIIISIYTDSTFSHLPSPFPRACEYLLRPASPSSPMIQNAPCISSHNEILGENDIKLDDSSEDSDVLLLDWWFRCTSALILDVGKSSWRFSN